MGVIRSFKRARGVPIPLGNPALVYIPYSFGQMKPLPFIPVNLTLTDSFQNYAQIFIPRNSWGDWKLLQIGFLIQVVSSLPNQSPFPDYTENYNIPGVGDTQRGLVITQLPPPQASIAWIERFFTRVSDDLYELNPFDGFTDNSAIAADGQIHRLTFDHSIAPFDPTLDNYINLQAMTSYAGSTDTITVLSGQAFIQSPLDLRRLSS